MRPRSRPVLALGLALACQPSQTDTTPFTTAPPNLATSDPSTSSSSGGSTSTTGGELSTGSGSGSASTGETTLILDVGSSDDLGPLQPEGCKGKIDFLFMISRHEYMDAVQAQLADAVPKFLETIQSKFADFDYHIMVVKGDPLWGLPKCDEECPGPFTAKCPAGDAYPCEMIGKLAECDTTWGAGAVFNAGSFTPNKPCEIADGRRYLTRDTPGPSESFACIAKVGTDGGDLLGEALVHAVSPELNDPGGCNEDFLRDDALLVATLVSWTADYDSEGTPADWAQAIVDAKDDEESVVMFSIGGVQDGEKCLAYDRVCQFVSLFPYTHFIRADEPDYGPGFDEATDLVEAACSKFIPQ
ncbi:hypothetical protein [Nannocystis bainbridge]|uniref:Uncharacterized protein n=1 Tax=Nannocystis bainbridge TaxID=2995303 RepID=A0ABT5EDY8_9BACT|nr:hypothetical protein [Nannocystis bainbridge]MDC0723534.1 hypothetical protein [Nannocystis bainbridge]